MKQFISTADVPSVPRLVDIALNYKKDPFRDQELGKNKTVGMIFLNPSLRTRLSTQVAAKNLGMEPIVFNIDKEGWALEMNDGVVMNGNTTEHVKEAAGVMGQYFDTINSAKQLRIDKRVGSLEVGKDADFVIWSANPLSSRARAEQTWIDGRRYFDRGEDAQLRERDRAERARLVALALPERAKAGSPPEGRPASPVSAALDQLELQRWLHEANRDRQSYFGGDAWHECTQQ